MAGKVSLPPSLSSFAQASDENERKQEARKHAVITAMRALPVIESAKLELLSFVSAFEMTYYDEERKPREASASPATVEKQLNNMAEKCRDVAKYLGKDAPGRDPRMEPRCWCCRSDFDLAVVGDFLDELASSAEQALEAFKGDQRAGATRGNPGDAMAAAMTVTAAFVFSRLTAKRISQATKSGSFEAFLERIFTAYGIEANLQHCIRKFKKSRFWRKLDLRNTISRRFYSKS